MQSMFSVLDRYLLGQIIRTLLGVTLVLLLIVVSNRMVRYFTEAASGNLPNDVIFVLLALKVISYLILLLPLSLYLAILLVLGRMYRDNEMAALGACGVGITRLFKPILMLSIPLSLLLAGVTLYSLPKVASMEYQILEKAERNVEITGIAAGRFLESKKGERIFYVEKYDEQSQRMVNAFIHVKRAGQTILLSSKTAYIETLPDTEQRYLILENGHRYEGVAGQGKFRVVSFGRYRLQLQMREPVGQKVKQNMVPTNELWGSTKLAHQAELQWRFSVPLATLLMALLALPMGKVKPRQGMYGKLLAAVLVYIVYSNLLVVAQAWTEQGDIPVGFGLWWVHILMLIFTVGLLLKQLGIAWLFGRVTQTEAPT